MKVLAVVGTVCATLLYVSTTTTTGGDSISLFSTMEKRDPALQKELEGEFVRFVATYGKSYASKTEVPSRFEQFAKNYMLIKEHNARGEEVTFKMAVNHMADLHESEVRSGIKVDEATLLEFQRTQLTQNQTGNFTPTYYPPIDWRNYDKVSPVLD